MSETHYIRRLVLVALILVMVFGGLGARLVYLHAGPHEQAQDRLSRSRRYTQELQVHRGRILDRRGQLLALDLPACHIAADPRRIVEQGHLGFTAHHAARILQLDRDEVYGRLNRPDDPYVVLKRYVPMPQSDTLRRLQLKGLIFEDTMMRQYPHGRAMCHVLGFTNWKRDGCGGVEQVMHDYLRGRPGLRVSQKDGRRHELYSRRELDVEPRQGADIELTIDMNIQFMLENALENTMQEHNAKGAWSIIQRVETGEILAMASRPNFDLNAFRTSSPQQQLNRPIGHVYEPGSTFKVAVVAAALNEGLVTPGQIIDCEKGCWHYGGRPLRDYHAYDELTVADVLKKSSNIGAAKIALRLGEARLESYLREFGFGKITGIDLPGEEHGILHSRRSWSKISATRLAMGHEVSVTALQMLNAVSAIANEGCLMRPTIIRRVSDANGRTLYEAEPEILGRPITAQTANIMRKLLARVTQSGGTGRRAQIDEYGVAGKTGTAQKVIDGQYSDSANMASFVGFLPQNHPEIAMIVVVDDPQPIRTGGQVAAPVFREVADQAMRYLMVAPYKEESFAVNKKTLRMNPSVKESDRDTGTIM